MSSSDEATRTSRRRSVGRSASDERIELAVDHDVLDVAPGGTVTLQVTVHNRGVSPVAPHLQLTGLGGCEVSGATSLPPLGPGTSCRSELRLRLPADAPAGQRRVALVVEDRTGRAAAAVAHVELRTGSAAGVSMNVSPRDPRGSLGAKFKVNLHNQGDTTVQLALRGEGDGVKVKISRPEVTLPPGTHVRVKAKARATRPVVARSRRLPFLVVGQGTTTPVTDAGTLQQSALFDGSMLKLVTIVVVLALWAAGAVAAVKTLTATKDATTAAPTTIAAPKTDASGTDGAPAADGGSGASGGADASKGGDGAGGAKDAKAADGKAGADAARPDTGALPGVGAVIVGTVSGPAQVAGITVGLEKISLGDAPTKGSGKLPANSASSLQASVGEQSTTTDDSGRFRFSSGLVVPALYRITVVKPGFEQASMVAELTSDKATIELSVGLKAASGRMTGVVRAQDGTPVTDAVVTVADNRITYSAVVASSGDAAGSWAIDGIATPGSYLVTVKSPGRASSSMAVTLDGGDTRTGVDLVMIPGAGTIRGGATSRGKGVGGLVVAVRQLDGDVERSTTTLTQPSLLGQFELPGLPLGRYTLTVSGDGWLTETSQVVLDSGELNVPVNDLRQSTATIQGRVLTEARTNPACQYPEPGYDPTKISAQPCGNVGVTVANDAGTYRTTSASGTGAFTVSGVPTGSYTVTLERYGYVSATLAVTVNAGDIATIGPDGPTGPEAVVLKLIADSGQGLAVIQGVLRDSTDPDTALQIECVGASLTVRDSTDPLAEPLLDAVALTTGCEDPPSFVPAALSYIYQCSDAPGAGPRACYTDDGGIRVQGLAAGAKQFRFSAVGFDDTYQVVQVPLGGTTELGVVLMKPLATLQGQVSGPNGVPLDHARVMVVPTSAATVLPPVPEEPVGGWYACTADVGGATRSGRCADTDVGGNYQFGRALRSADYQVYAPVGVLTDPDDDIGPPAVTLDHELRVRNATVTAGQSTPLDISLRRYGAVYGVIQTPGGNGGFSFVTDVDVKVETVTSGGTATDVTADVRVTTGTGANAGSFRIDRLTTLEPSTSRYRITFSNDTLEPVEVTIPGGVPFNTELLRNLVMTSEPWTVTGKVTWKANPAAVGAGTAITTAQLAVTGATSYRLFDAPPYREAVVATDNVVTNGSGTYPTGAQFVGPSVDIVVTAPGFAPKTVTVNAPGGTVPDIVLDPLTRTLNGTFALSPAIDPLDNELVTPESIYPTLTVTARSQTSGRSVSTTLTTTGAFTFFDLRPGDYTMTISGPGVTAQSFSTTLVPSAADTDQEVSNRTIVRTGMIAVAVKHYVTASSSDYGVGGVTVKAWLNGAVVQQIVTCVDPTAVGGVPGCAAGTAVFRDLALGEYTLTASKDGWYDPTDPNGTGDTDVHLGVGSVAPRAPTQTVTLPAMRPYGTVSGVVRGALVAGDTNGVPLAGATVTAVSTNLTPVVTVIGSVGLNGTFKLSGRMPAGSYSVTATMPKYTSPVAVTVAVVDDANTPVAGDIVLVAAPSGLSGTVYDEGTTAQKDITVRIVELPSLTAFVTDTDGKWSFTGLAPRSYTVEFTAADGRAPVSRLITLSPGTDQVLDIHMVGPSGSLYGVVTSTPVGGAAVPLAGATVTWTYKSVSNQTTTDAGGSYSFDGVPVTASPDTITFTVTAPQHAAATPRTLTLSAGQRLYVAVALVPTGRVLDVTVVDKADQHVLSGVRVTATSGSTTQFADSDNTGKVSLTLTPGSWSLTTTLAGTGTDPHYDQTTAVAVTVPSPPAAMPTPKLSLTPWEGFSIVVTKRDHATGAATVASGATVVATVAGVSSTLTESTTAGTYKLRGAFGATTASVAVSLTNYANAGPTSVSVASGQIASQSMVLTASPRTFDLTVSSSGTGTPTLSGVAVSAVMTGAPTMTASGTTNGSGVVRLSLAPGAWTFTTTNADTVGHQNGSTTATVAVGDPATALTGSLSLDEVTEAIDGVVLSTYPGSTLDVALPGATVTATKSGGGSYTATSDTDGAYQVKVFAATGWSLNASAVGFNPPSSQTLTVTAGQVTTASDLRMERKAASISGTVSITNQPISGATVSYRPHGSTAAPTVITTKTNGTYKINAVDPNVTWDVTFSSTVNNKVRQPVTYQVTATKNGDAITLNQTYSNSAGAISVTIVGRLQNQPTVAVVIPSTGPDVVVSNSTANLVDPVTPVMTENTTTKAWSATVSDLPQSSAYTVTASATGFGRTDGTAGAVSGSVNLSSTAASTTLTLTPLPRPLTVTLKDADGNAVGNAELKLQGGGLLTSASLIGSTDSDGKVTFPNVPVSFAPAAQYTVTLTGTTGIEGGTSNPFDVGFSATGSAATLTLELSRLRATVTGKALVDDATAAAMTATSVTAVAGSKTITLAATATTGTYERMGLLPAAAWTVTATATGYADKTLASTATAAGTTTTLAMPMTLSTRSASVSVASSDSAIGALTHLSITATAGSNSRTASTSPATLQLEPGTWTITATADDHSSKSTTVTVAIAPAAGPAAVSLALDPLEHTILVTLDSTDTAVTALTGISATKTSGPHAAISSTVNGNVVTLVVRTGTYGFTVSATGQRDGTLTFTAPLGSGVSQPSLTLKREKVTLSLTDSASTPAALAGATVTMDVAGTPVTLTESAGTPGTYEYAGLVAAGTYTITAVASGFVDGTVSATITAGAQVAKTLALTLVPQATTTTTTTVAATTSTTATATTATTADPGTTTTTPAGTVATTTATTADPGTTTTT